MTEFEFTEKSYQRLMKIVSKDRELNWWMFFILCWLLLLTVAVIAVAIYLSKSLNSASGSFSTLTNEVVQLINILESIFESLPF